MNPDEEKNELEREWLRHPYTSKMLRDSEGKKESAFIRLETSCRITTDPAVREAYAQWASWRAFTESLGGKP